MLLEFALHSHYNSRNFDAVAAAAAAAAAAAGAAAPGVFALLLHLRSLFHCPHLYEAHPQNTWSEVMQAMPKWVTSLHSQ